jgi:hypothetical protein
VQGKANTQQAVNTRRLLGVTAPTSDDTLSRLFKSIITATKTFGSMNLDSSSGVTSVSVTQSGIVSNMQIIDTSKFTAQTVVSVSLALDAATTATVKIAGSVFPANVAQKEYAVLALSQPMTLTTAGNSVYVVSDNLLEVSIYDIATYTKVPVKNLADSCAVQVTFKVRQSLFPTKYAPSCSFYNTTSYQFESSGSKVSSDSVINAVNGTYNFTCCYNHMTSYGSSLVMSNEIYNNPGKTFAPNLTISVLSLLSIMMLIILG